MQLFPSLLHLAMPPSSCAGTSFELNLPQVVPKALPASPPRAAQAAPGLAWVRVPFPGSTGVSPSQQSWFFTCCSSLPVGSRSELGFQPSTGHLSPAALPTPPKHPPISSSCPYGAGPVSSADAPAWTGGHGQPGVADRSRGIRKMHVCFIHGYV